MNKPKVVIAGGSGTVGTAIGHHLERSGYVVFILSRQSNPKSPFQSYKWDPVRGEIDPGALAGAHAVINVTGTPLDGKRWTPEYKRTIRDSRVIPALFLRNQIQRLASPPKVYLGASAIGLYGDRGDKWLREGDVEPWDHFLFTLGQEWESAHQSGELSETRTVILRFGLILTLVEGYLPSLIQPAKFGVLPYFGDGRMWQSWIHVSDIAGIAKFCIGTGVHGVFNAVAPTPERLKDFMRILRRIRGKPGILIPVPLFALKIVLGEMAEILFYSQWVSAGAIETKGYEFNFPDLESALKDLVIRA